MNEDIENDSITDSKPNSSVKLLLVGVLATVLSLSIIVFTKDPGQGGPLIVLTFLLLTFLFALLGSITVLRLIERRLSKKFSWLRVLYTGVALAAGIVFLIGLKTLRQLQVIDVTLVLVFEFLLNFYLLRRF